MATTGEIKETLRVISEVFPTFRLTEGAKEQWLRLFAEAPYTELIQAIDHFTKTAGTAHPPTISQMFQSLREVNPTRIPKFTGSKPEATPVSEELLRQQVAAAREKHPELYR